MKKIICFVFMILSLSGMAQTKSKLSPDEFLKLYDRGRIKFETMPIMKQIIESQLLMISQLDQKDANKVDLAMLTSIEKEMIKEYQRAYKFFEPEMLNIRYVDDGGYRYSIFFEFNTTRQCKFRVDTLDMNCGNPICSATSEPEKHANIDRDGVVIADSYCEKAYNIKIKKE